MRSLTGRANRLSAAVVCAVLTVCGVLAGAGCAAVPPRDWPMWGYDAARSGATPMRIPKRLHLQWLRRLGTPRPAWPLQLDDIGKLDFDLSYTPVVMDDLVFVGSMVSDRVTAYRIDDGAEVWRFYTDGPVRLAPAAWDGRIYLVSDDGHLHCLNAQTGEQLWRFRAGPTDHLVLGNCRVVSMWAARGGPVVKDGTVYFAAGVWPFMGTFAYALDAASGAIVWQNTGESTNWQRQPHGGAYSFAGISPQGYLAATEDRLVVSGGRSTPALLDRHTGELLYLDVYGRGVGGYRVEADGEHFYNHGARHRLEDGQRDGDGLLVNEVLLERAERVADRVDGPIFTVLAARGRVLLTTADGTLYCFGPEVSQDPLVHDERAGFVGRAAVFPPPDGERGAAIVRRAAAIGGGYALFLGVGDGELMETVARRTELHLVGVDPDREKLEALRRHFDDAGLYGTRIALLPGRAADLKYPPYISSLIVVEDPAACGLSNDEVYELLRPYGGVAFVGDDVLVREGPLPDAGQWTHQYADAARSAVSRDDRVRLPLGLLWYGTVSNNNVLPRHAAGPRPQVAGGRLAILGVECIGARDVYTGRELWVRSFPGVGHPFTNLELEEKWRAGEDVYMSNIPGAAYIGSPYVTLPDSIYLRYRGRIHRLDAATGETLAEFPLYPEGTPPPNDWGPVSVWENLLITCTDPHEFDDRKLGWSESWNATSSSRLVVMDRFTGEVLWTRAARIGFRHNAIVAGNGRVTVIDGLSEQALEFMERRGAAPDAASRIISMNAPDGRVLWEADSDVFGTYLAYSEEHDILLESGSADGRRRLPDEPVPNVTARCGADGRTLWTGTLQFPAAIVGDLLFPARPGEALNLRDGTPAARPHPITGEEITEQYWKAYGCGAANASTHMLLFRSGAAGFFDLEHGSGTGNFGGFKSGCTANLIAADGVLNAPDYTRTCRCSYQNQTSLGLIHMPDADLWTAVTFGRGQGPIQRLGVNLGAPGSRRADNGTLWTPYPYTGAPGPDLGLLVNTVDFVDVPVRIVGVSASSGEDPAGTIDGNPATRWRIGDDRQGRFDQWIAYELNQPADMDCLDLAWAGPRGTRLQIQTSPDAQDWTTVLEMKGQGTGREARTCTLAPTRARWLRLTFGEHDELREDAKGERLAESASVYSLRLGGLVDPDAYAYFLPKPVFRKHTRLVDGADGLRWVAASGIRGLRYFRLQNVNPGGGLYTVTLHFAEPDDLRPGQRVFDIRLQGKVVAEEFDVVREAGGPDRAVTRTFTNVPIAESLLLELQQAPGSPHPPLLCGVELVQEG
ncbi:MAG: PQQ-binding-like beta-propeller repeat protein [Candidatus Brocadiaceae bacterium]|nr:PQQ-binding-like beta-propeller repeat protein [Candidatus Brocadiaceae bacterium]